METRIGASSGVAERAAAGRQRRRRSQFLRNLVVLVAMAAALAVVMVWKRNSLRLAEARDAFAAAAAGIVSEFEETGSLPEFYTAGGQSHLRPQDFHYMDPQVARRFGATTDRLIVAHSGPVRQILRPEKRVVAVREAGDILVLVMPDAEFREEYQRLQEQAGAAHALDHLQRDSDYTP